jgi:hypothetical protein
MPKLTIGGYVRRQNIKRKMRRIKSKVGIATGVDRIIGDTIRGIPKAARKVARKAARRLIPSRTIRIRGRRR